MAVVHSMCSTETPVPDKEVVPPINVASCGLRLQSVWAQCKDGIEAGIVLRQGS